MCIHLCASMCVYVSAAGFLGQVSQQWFGQNGTKSLCEWHTSQRVSCHVLLLREEPAVTLSCSNQGELLFLGAKKQVFCNWGYRYSRYKDRNVSLIVCMWFWLSVFVRVNTFVWVLTRVWMTDQRRWATDRARHPGTIQIRVQTLALPPTFLLIPPLRLLSPSAAAAHTQTRCAHNKSR